MLHLEDAMCQWHLCVVGNKCAHVSEKDIPFSETNSGHWVHQEVLYTTEASNWCVYQQN